MEAFLIGIVLILLLGAGILSARLACYEKQMRHMLKELHLAEQAETNILLTSAAGIGKTEEVISMINRVLEKNRRSKEQLFKENRSYRESITSISHDIRTPLTSAKGYIQMMQNAGVTGEKKKEYAKMVERHLDGLAEMLNQLFLYARIEAGELALNIEEINAANLFAETVSLFYEDFVNKNCEPIVRISSKPCRIHADKQAFVRIVENLIKNALVHGTGGYEMSLQTDGGEAVIWVSNDTEGIEQKDIGSIFDRFYTTDSSRSRKTTGLGLAVVKGLTEQMGGNAAAGLEDGIFWIEVRFPVLEL